MTTTHQAPDRPSVTRPSVTRPSVMTRFGRFVVRRRRAVILAWVVALIGTAAVGSSAFSVLSTDFGAGNSTESGRVAHRLDDLAETGGQLAIVADRIDIADPRVQRSITADLARIAAVDGVLDVADPWTSGPTAEQLRATDGRAALIVVTLAGNLDENDELAVAHRVEQIARNLDAPEVLVGGAVLVGETFQTASESDLLRGEAIALPIAIVIMVLLLGGLVAGGMPLLVALGGVIPTLAVLVAATRLGDVSIFSVNVVNMLGIGLGIDYGLLLVNRFREERGKHTDAGRDVHDAVVATVASAGTTIVFSALTVAVAMSGLFVFGIPLLASFGIAGLAVVLLCMSAAITLLPATLAVVGRRIKPLPPTPDVRGRFYRLARAVQLRPVAVGLAVAVALVLLGIPFLSARFENGDARTLPRSSEARATALALADRFPARGTDPVTVIADIDPTDPAAAAWLADLAATPGVAGTAIRPGTPAGLSVVDFIPTGTSQGPAATALVERIRTNAPAFDIQVGGPAAELADVKSKLGSRLPVAAAVVALATLLLLFLMTGSVVIPLKALVMNVLSLGASFGALKLVFQDGHLSGLLAFDSVGALDLWMPVLVLIFAFGLSMDYGVFLLSRIKEVHEETGDNETAVAVGLQRSGRIITSAAALIVVVFAGFALGEVLAVKQLGVGLAIAVVVDATLVRMLLVPAVMSVLGEWNWWAPAPLRRFHARYGLHEAPSAPVTPPLAVPVPVDVRIPAQDAAPLSTNAQR
ncbi:MAG: putative drug exporter of the superfamily [Actinomycetota bacterium]|jgi:RND superfamily putative drug exporter|nr:putative drug exporter of the superfamily [Actinomycetota bacterium]